MPRRPHPHQSPSEVTPFSPKHGVNPSLSTCFFCGGDKNEVILAGRLPGDQESPHKAVWSMEPCDKCKGYMEQGIILISTRDGESGNNPYRTGGWCVVTEDAIRRMITPSSLVEDVLLKRIAFLDDSTWDQIGLPRGPIDEK